MLVVVFSKVLQLSLMGAAAVCLIQSVKGLLRDRLSPAWHYHIWFLLLLRLLIPFTPQAPVGLQVKSEENTGVAGIVQKVMPRSISPIQEEKPSRPADVKTLPAEVTEAPAVWESPENSHTAEAGYGNSPEEGSWQPPYPVLELAAWLWLVGVVVLSLYILAVCASLGRKVMKSREEQPGDVIKGLLDECKGLAGISRYIPVVIQRHVKTPSLYGIFHPCLLLPAEVVEHLSREELRCVILHELCHYKRRDLLVNTVQILVGILHWFNPLIIWAMIKMSEDREPVCDRMVLAHVGKGERKRYAGTLLKLLEAFSGSGWLPGTAGILQGRAVNMERRLKAMGVIKRKPFLWGAVATLIVLLLGSASVYAIQSHIGFDPVVKADSAGPGKTGRIVGEKKTAVRAGIEDRNGTELVRRLEGGRSEYPYGNLASHVIGFLDEDGRGTRGVEQIIDARSYAGGKVTLTLDKNIQEITERILDQAIADSRLKGGAAAIVTDPATGEVLALVSKPDFDPNMPAGAPPEIGEKSWNTMLANERDVYLKSEIWFNRAIAKTWQPGPVFKAITAAAGLEEGLAAPDSRVDDSTVPVDYWKIHCWNMNGHGDESFSEAVWNSCNPVFVRLAHDLGKDRFYSYIRKFGFYERSGTGLREEAPGKMGSNSAEIDIARASIGQRYEITPIQLAAAYGAIANGGELIKPQIIREVTDGQGDVIRAFAPDKAGKVMSGTTAEVLRTILEGVVSKGTGANAFVKGYGIAGKTGTSERTMENGKRMYDASFAGFAPYDRPRIAFVIVCFDPQVEAHTGGMVAAPAAGRLAREILDYLEDR